MSKKLVLFVHGLGGKPSDTWGSFERLIAADSELSSHMVAHFQFPTFLFRLPFERRFPPIQTLADALHTQLCFAIQNIKM
jgi:hypothetical protein